MYTIIKEFVEILLIIQYSSELNALDDHLNTVLMDSRYIFSSGVESGRELCFITGACMPSFKSCGV